MASSLECQELPTTGQAHHKLATCFRRFVEGSTHIRWSMLTNALILGPHTFVSMLLAVLGGLHAQLQGGAPCRRWTR